jgi:SAM-dependent methyltransferase
MITTRRTLLDDALNRALPFIRGRVLDIGGNRKHKRGRFRPPLDRAQSWFYLNSDPLAAPDCCCSAEDIPAAENSMDTVIMTEVIEYLKNPQQALKEVYRVLSHDGVGLFSVPFLVSVHGDYWADRQRFTALKLQEMFKDAGFRAVEIQPMGSVGSVMWDIFYVSTGYARGNKIPVLSTISRIILFLLKPFVLSVDSLMKAQKEFITTGYFIIARK